MLKRFLYIAFVWLFVCRLSAQNSEQGTITGNVQIDAQTYIHDAKIGADSVPERMLSNSYMNLNYNKGNFSAGVRFEAYLNTMLGYDNRYDGMGLAYRFGRYQNDFIDITAGNFYGQFGSGAVFRAYEERTLGYDNAMDGFMVKIKPVNGVMLTGIIGKQRLYWDKGDGTVRGIDADISLNDIIGSWADSKTRISLGGSYVSKYQKDNDPLLMLPENVGAGAGRINLSNGGFSMEMEYAWKSQDPSSDNNYIYKPGSTFITNASYGVKGFGLMLQYKWVDNMSFRSDRNAQLNDVAINYLPTITKNHTYAFTPFYPYVTQLVGEAGFQGELFYRIKRGSALGGKYGMHIAINYSRIHDIKREATDSKPIGQRATDGYKTSFLSMSDSLLNSDFSIELTKKFSRRVKGIFTWQKADYNIAVI
ncbi:MAG: DUF6029 family protein, partial [Bacteroidales bacterium]|nr:DUF6029 family protein [Bacteroidales bacterium]